MREESFDNRREARAPLVGPAARLEQDLGGRHRAKRLPQPVPARRDPKLPQLAVLSLHADLAADLVNVDAYVVHDSVSRRGPTPQLSVWQLRGAPALHPIYELR
ncbi:MAG: hypothetical protein H6725_05675 [Sandaracinaceae bacterium]|nr:hypothetical protein [Sandaracinaceae bacterium]